LSGWDSLFFFSQSVIALVAAVMSASATVTCSDATSTWEAKEPDEGPPA